MSLRSGKLQHNQRLMEEIADVEIMFAILQEQNLIDRQIIDAYKVQKRIRSFHHNTDHFQFYNIHQLVPQQDK